MTSIVIATIALVGSALAVSAQLLVHYRAEQRETKRALRTYREPLISAAYDLQSRLFNLLRKDFSTYITDDRWGRKDEGVTSTLFAFAQYFGWREILRRETQLLEFETKPIGRVLSAITGTFGSDDFGEPFLIWKGEQRALGEAMIGEWHGAPACVGYLEFLCRRRGVSPWLTRLEEDLERFAHSDEDDARLLKIQELLVRLIETLDPEHLRYAPDRLQVASELPRIGSAELAK